MFGKNRLEGNYAYEEMITYDYMKCLISKDWNTYAKINLLYMEPNSDFTSYNATLCAAPPTHNHLTWSEFHAWFGPFCILSHLHTLLECPIFPSSYFYLLCCPFPFEREWTLEKAGEIWIDGGETSYNLEQALKKPVLGLLHSLVEWALPYSHPHFSPS